MKTRTKRIAGLAAIGLLAGGGIAGAFAATSGQDDPASSFAAALSKESGTPISPTQVKAAFKDVMKARLDTDVAAGRITQAQADQMLARAGDGAPMPGMGGPGGDHGGPHMGRRGAHHEAVHAAIAHTLGMTDAELQAARDAGKTPADIAKAKGVSRADLIASVTAALKKDAPPQGARALTSSDLAQIAGDIVDGKGHGGPGGHRGPGGPDGPPAGMDAPPAADAAPGTSTTGSNG